MRNKIFHHLEWVSSLLLAIIISIQALLGDYILFIPAGLFLIDSIVSIISLFKNKGLKIASIVQFISSPGTMVLLLLNTIFVLKNGYMLFVQISGVAYLLFKIGLTIYYGIDSKKNNDYENYARFNNGIVSSLYALNFITCSFLYIGSSDQTTWLFILIKVIVNAISTFAVAYFALAFVVVSFSKQILNFKEKIKAVANFFVKYEIGFIFSETFALITCIVCIVNFNKGDYFKYLAGFYLLIFVIRLMTFFWSRSLKKKSDTPLSLSKGRNALLLVSSAILLASGDTLTGALVNMSIHKYTSSLPIWFFVAFMFPFAVMNFVIAIIGKKASKTKDDAALEASSDQSLLISIYSFFAGATYFLKYISDENIVGFIFVIFLFSILVIQTVILITSLVKGIIGCSGRRKIQKEQQYDIVDSNN